MWMEERIYISFAKTFMWPSVNLNILTNQIDIRSEKTHVVTRCKQAQNVQGRGGSRTGLGSTVVCVRFCLGCLSCAFVLLAGRRPCRDWACFPYSVDTEMFHTVFCISDLPNQKYCVKIKITTCMWLGALRLRSSQQRKLLKSFGEVSWCRFSFFRGLFVVGKQSCCTRSFVFWTQVRRSAGLQTLNWTVSPVALTVCSLLNWHKHLWMQMETMYFRSEQILMP